jgi:hypothetical protein
MKKILGLILAVLVSNVLIAQEENKKGKPDIPGTLLIDLGFNFLNDAPVSMDTKFFGSKTLNLYYQYDIKMGDSKFSFHPGIGVGIDKYAFDTVTLIHAQDVNGEYANTMVKLEDLLPNASGFDKTKLAATYLDLPFEFRFHTNPYDKSRSFKFGLGGRIGLRLSSQTKIKYREDGNTVKFKNNQSFDMNPIRYGATARIGIGWFNLFYYHNFSELFKSGKGPEGTAATNYTVGLTIAGF